MKALLMLIREQRHLIGTTVLLIAALAYLMLFRLGTLVPGFSAVELPAATSPIGWHGLYNHPFYLPLQAVRAVVFFLFSDHGAFLTRLPSTVFGVLAIAAFAGIVRLWHGPRTTAFATLLFATSAWTLHVSRLASGEVLYLLLLPALLAIQSLMQRHGDRAFVFYGSVAALGLLLYVPGAIWFILISLYLQREALAESWRDFSAWWQRLLHVLCGLVWLPLLIVYLANHTYALKSWLGLPARFPDLHLLGKQLLGVPVHLLVRGPQYPDMWLGRLPILDLFTLAICIVGAYFYVTHLRAARSRMLIAYFLLGWALIALGGPVGLSVLVPLLYLCAATGITYLLHEWLATFPLNPLARGVGIGLIAVAVFLSCAYNTRSYFVAWPHNTATRATFHYQR